MHKKLIDILKVKGYIKGGKANLSGIHKSKPKDLVSVSEIINDITSAEHFIREESIFSHTASLALSGGRDACIDRDCRRNRVRELARFAGLYSDRVFIRNYFIENSFYGDNMAEYEHLLKYNFANDVILILELLPLMEEGLVVPFTPPLDYCPHCLVKTGIRASSRSKVDKEFNKLQNDIVSNISVKIFRDGNNYILEEKGPTDIIWHGTHLISYESMPTEWHGIPGLEEKVNAGKIYNLDKCNIKRLKIDENCANSMFMDVGFSLLSSQAFNTSILTDSRRHIDILDSITHDAVIKRNNKLAQEYMSAIVPVAGDLDVKDLVSLRKREADSFIIFRNSLEKAIIEYSNTKKGLNVAKAKDLHHTIIAPELAKLENKIKNARRGFVKSARRDLVGWAGAISFGLYAGFLKSDIASAAAAMGLAAISAAIKNIMERSDSEESIKADNYYFLWKMHKLKK